MPFSCVTEKFIEELELLEPFGKGNPKPVFAEKNVEILNARRIGKNQNMLKMLVKDETGTAIEALYFGDAQKLLDTISQKYGKEQTEKIFTRQCRGIKMSFTYYPGINEYKGKKTPQIIITHFQ